MVFIRIYLRFYLFELWSSSSLQPPQYICVCITISMPPIYLYKNYFSHKPPCTHIFSLLRASPFLYFSRSLNIFIVSIHKNINYIGQRKRRYPMKSNKPQQPKTTILDFTQHRASAHWYKTPILWKNNKKEKKKKQQMFPTNEQPRSIFATNLAQKKDMYKEVKTKNHANQNNDNKNAVRSYVFSCFCCWWSA